MFNSENNLNTQNFSASDLLTLENSFSEISQLLFSMKNNNLNHKKAFEILGSMFSLNGIYYAKYYNVSSSYIIKQDWNSENVEENLDNRVFEPACDSEILKFTEKCRSIVVSDSYILDFFQMRLGMRSSGCYRRQF